MADDPLIADLVRVLPYSSIPTEDDARAVLDFIAETRRLLPAGGAVVVATTEAGQGFTERVEWASHGGALWWGADGDQARREAAEGKGPLMRRNVYEGPWEIVTEEGADHE